MTLTILEVLYIVLIIFSSIIGTLTIFILIRILKILGPIMEVVELYNKIKSIFSAYSSIPEILKDKFLDIFNKKDTN